jgi:hypothetical protein
MTETTLHATGMQCYQQYGEAFPCILVPKSCEWPKSRCENDDDNSNNSLFHVSFLLDFNNNNDDYNKFCYIQERNSNTTK